MWVHAPKKEGAKPEKPVQNGPGGGKPTFERGRKGAAEKTSFYRSLPPPHSPMGTAQGFANLKKSRFFFKKK